MKGKKYEQDFAFPTTSCFRRCPTVLQFVVGTLKRFERKSEGKRVSETGISVLV